MKTKLKTITLLLATFNLLSAFSQTNETNKTDNIIILEAEKFEEQTLGEVRSWKKINFETNLSEFGETNESNSSSNNAYIQILPDTRKTDKDKLENGVNFSDSPGKLAIVSYSIKFKKTGRYYVWARSLATGSEDNGLHVGIDNTWPSSGEKMQWCGDRGKWMWGSKQRTKEKHCGEPYMIYLDVTKKGKHTIQFSMREDGFRLDKFLLTTNKNYVPSND